MAGAVDDSTVNIVVVIIIIIITITITHSAGVPLCPASCKSGRYVPSRALRSQHHCMWDEF